MNGPARITIRRLRATRPPVRAGIERLLDPAEVALDPAPVGRRQRVVTDLEGGADAIKRLGCLVVAVAIDARAKLVDRVGQAPVPRQGRARRGAPARHRSHTDRRPRDAASPESSRSRPAGSARSDTRCRPTSCRPVIGGKPIVKFNARMPTSLAAPKWPSSWMKIRSSRPRIAMAKLTLPPPPVPWPVRERARCTPAPVRARSAAPSRSDPGFVRPHPGYRQNRCPPRGSLQPRSHWRHSGCRAQCHRPRPASRASRRHRKASRSGGSKSRLNAAPRSSRAAGVAARAG